MVIDKMITKRVNIFLSIFSKTFTFGLYAYKAVDPISKNAIYRFQIGLIFIYFSISYDRPNN